MAISGKCSGRRKRLKQAKSVAVGCHQLPIGPMVRRGSAVRVRQRAPTKSPAYEPVTLAGRTTDRAARRPRNVHRAAQRPDDSALNPVPTCLPAPPSGVHPTSTRRPRPRRPQASRGARPRARENTAPSFPSDWNFCAPGSRASSASSSPARRTCFTCRTPGGWPRASPRSTPGTRSRHRPESGARHGRGWSGYGAERAQRAAVGGTGAAPKKGSNVRKPW